MGYYAYGAGEVTLIKELPEQVLKDVKDIYSYTERYKDTLFFSIDSNYHEDDVVGLLDELKPYISEGLVEYTGEEDTHWRFSFKDGEWTEFNGRTVYDDEPFIQKTETEEFIGQLIDQVEDIIASSNTVVFKGNKFDELKKKFTEVLSNWKVIET